MKSGSNPAPISIATVRSFQGRDQQGQYSDTCCQGVSETETVYPKPNDITEIPVNFRVEAKQYDPNTGQAGWFDWVVVNVHGETGTLPIHDNGEPKPFGTDRRVLGQRLQHLLALPADRSEPAQPEPLERAGLRGPHELRLVPGRHGRPDPAGAGRLFHRSRRRRLRRRDGGGGTQDPPGGTTAPGQTTPPASVAGSRLTLRGSKVALRVKCDSAARTAPGRSGSRRAEREAADAREPSRIGIPSGKTATVKVRLSKRNRRRIKPGGLKVLVEVDLGADGKVTRKATLRRGQ